MQVPNGGRTRLARNRDNVKVAAAAAWKTAQIVDEWKVRSLLRGDPFDDGIWKQMAAPAWHAGTPPRRIDLIANRAVESAIRVHRPDATVTSEEDEGAWDDAPGVELFLTDPEDGTDNGRAVGFADATVVLVFSIGDRGQRHFCGGAIATGNLLLEYVVYNRVLVEATMSAPYRGSQPDEPVSDTALIQGIDEIVPGDPMLIAALGARSKHRAKAPIRALMSSDNPAWMVGLAGAPMAARLIHGPLGSVVSASPQKLRDAAHLPLVAGLNGLVTDLSGNLLPVFDLFEEGDEVPPSIAASSREALDVVLHALGHATSMAA